MLLRLDEGFAKILDEDMRYDLRSYLFFYGSKNLKVEDISSIVKYNEMDSVERDPTVKEFSKNNSRYNDN